MHWSTKYTYKVHGSDNTARTCICTFVGVSWIRVQCGCKLDAVTAVKLLCGTQGTR